MKRIYYLAAFALLGGAAVNAQNYGDALRYSTEELGGTARFRGLSGAFGALGGDPSAININPAGSAVYNASEISFSLNNNARKYDINFLDTKSTDKMNDFNVNQFSVNFVIPTGEPVVKKITFAFNYNQMKNFDVDKFTFFGNGGKGLTDYFTHYANSGNGGSGYQFGYLTPIDLYNRNINTRWYQEDVGEQYAHLRGNARTAFLGVISGIVEPVALTATNTSYTSNGGNNWKHKYKLERDGYVNKYNFNFGMQLGDYVFVGTNLNSHSINERAFYGLRDDAIGGNSTVTYVNHQQRVETTGSGFSFQLGAIAKPIENLRLGVSYQSPTWYSMKEQYREVLYSKVGTQDRDLELLNHYSDPIWFEREYKFRTPSAWTGSAAYIIAKRAILSVDYTYKAYDNLTFRSSNMRDENQIIQNDLGDTSALRIGGEFRVPFKMGGATNYWSFRAGYRYEQSPYRKEIAPVGDLTAYSGGIGVTLGGVRLDASYDVAKQTNTFQMYENVLTDKAEIKSTQGNFLFTFTARLF
jgi:membrane protein involved in aromatic hydrocarbon degradation